MVKVCYSSLCYKTKQDRGVPWLQFAGPDLARRSQVLVTGSTTQGLKSRAGNQGGSLSFDQLLKGLGEVSNEVHGAGVMWGTDKHAIILQLIYAMQ